MRIGKCKTNILQIHRVEEVYVRSVCVCVCAHVICVQPGDLQSPERLSICLASLSSHSPPRPGQHGPLSSDASPLRSENHIDMYGLAQSKRLADPVPFPRTWHAQLDGSAVGLERAAV